MGRVFRTMKSQGSKPLCGDESFELGVTVYPHAAPDVTPDETRCIKPGAGGMSVFAAIKQLPGRLIPARLRELYPEDFQKAVGGDDLTIWCINIEHFRSGANDLMLRWTAEENPRHGSVEPSLIMRVDDMQKSLCSTADLWEVCETP